MLIANERLFQEDGFQNACSAAVAAIETCTNTGAS